MEAPSGRSQQPSCQRRGRSSPSPPSDNELTVYSVSGSEITSASRFPNSRASNLFGLDRDQRAQGPEIAALANSVPFEDWSTCDPLFVDACLSDEAVSEPVKLSNTSPYVTLCGDVLIVETSPIAYSYRELFDGYRFDERAVRLEISCSTA